MFEKFRENIEWVITLGGAILTLLSALIYFIYDNKQKGETIDELTATNKILVEQVAKHDGAIEQFNNAIRLFMDNPPGMLNYKIEELKKEVHKYHGDDDHDEEVETSSNASSSNH